MRQPRGLPLLLAVLVASGAAWSAPGPSPTPSTAADPPRRDPLAEDIARWKAFLQGVTAKDGIAADIKSSAGPVLDSAEKALAGGKRLFALQRLTAARTHLSALEYLLGLPPAAKEPAGFEEEWKVLGRSAAGLGGGGRDVTPLAGVRPAVVRALGEAALPQVGVYYEASLEYGRSTEPENGLFYLGIARAQRDVAAFCRGLREPSPGAAPPVRSLGVEIDELERSLLRAYRPPASIERHSEFIAASATLKEARELEKVGLHHGALLRYLQAAQRLAVLTAPQEPDGDLAQKLETFAARLSPDRDESIARLFVEVAEADLATAAAPKRPVQAGAIVADVLPRYLAALGPVPAVSPRPPAKVTVTLVRWPYT